MDNENVELIYMRENHIVIIHFKNSIYLIIYILYILF